MARYHAVAWIDHREAHVLHFTPDEVEKTLVQAHAKHRQTHHRKGVIGGGKAPEDREYFKQIVASLAGAADHPSDGELLKLARHYFVGADRMRTQPGTRPS